GDTIASPSIAAVNCAAADMGGAHPATVEAASTHAASTAAAGKCIIWNQARSHKDGCREADQTVANHGILLLLARLQRHVATSSDAAPARRACAHRISRASSSGLI